MEIVLVHWSIRKGSVVSFLEARQPIPDDTPGFLGETLYRAQMDDAEFVAFLNVGRWARRQDFYEHFKDVATPGEAPALLEFEFKPRVREWVSPITRDPDGT